MELVARLVEQPGGTKARLRTVWVDPALVADAAICALDGFTDRALHAVPRKYVLKRSSSLAHLDRSLKRERVRQ